MIQKLGTEGGSVNGKTDFLREQLLTKIEVATDCGCHRLNNGISETIEVHGEAFLELARDPASRGVKILYNIN
jgi:hypothetical protein